ncbi:callose synthase 9 [Senna tora]|uniref:1,3-beta-glucan synthase n=1 Tax=Senna tora TaxID=362788 RepID=A0A835CDX9_9FABA|nr:callose synthase 9 [Senna tora]
MSGVEALWERLVRAALRRERTGDDTYGRLVGGIAGNVPSALAKNRDIDEILRVADEIQDDDPNVSRILCEHAYSLSQNLDPNSEGRGVLQFKTGLMSVIKQKLAKREVGTIDRSQDIARLQEFYKRYREKHNVDQLREEEKKLRESGAFSANLSELERKTVKRKRVFASLKVLGMVIEQLSPEIPEELKRVMESDSAMTEDLIAYNIIPIDAPSLTNVIMSLLEVQAAVAALKYFHGLPELPQGYPIPPARDADMLDFLQCIFGFQKDNVSNQREHLVHLLANEQSRLGTPDETEPKLDEAAVHNVFLKSLENYIKWCDYLVIQPVWSSLDAVCKEKKLLYVSLYYLIWGEAANIRFLPECLCYIFHHIAREMDEIIRQKVAQPANSCISQDGVSFLDQVILPLYDVVAAEAANNDNGKASHSSWRNYDDFNEYFWYGFFDDTDSLSVALSLVGHGARALLSSKSHHRDQSLIIFLPPMQNLIKSGRSQRRGKTSFVEHRSFFHLYHSFHRLWIFLFMMFQGLTLIAFNNGHLNAKTLREVLSLGPTFVVMKFFESVLDIFMMYGAYTTTRHLAVSRIFLRFLWFSAASVFITFLYVKALMEESKQNGNSVFFRLYVIVIGIYAGVQIFISFLMRIPACHRLTNQCDRWSLIRLVKWMRQERYYVGRGMYERSTDFIKYLLFWLVVLGGKFSFAYFLQIRPLVDPTRIIVDLDNLEYSWHDLVSKNNHNVLTVVSLWAPVFAMYLLDIYVFYTVVSAVWGFLLGARDRLGEIRSLESLHKQFEQFPGAFMDTLHVPLHNRSSRRASGQAVESNKVDAARFSPFWNEIIRNLREEDYITNLEVELLLMPKNSGDLPLVQWPLFLLASKIFLAKDIAVESRDTQDELWDRISRDDYMKYAVQECYYAIKLILTEILDDVGRMWVERVYDDINTSITKKAIHVDFQLNKLPLLISRVSALMGILKEPETPELERGAVKAVQDLYDVVTHDVLSINMREHYDTWNLLSKARKEGRLFAKLKWPNNADLRAQVKRLHSLLTIQHSGSNIPKNLEARRRLEFFANSLFMKMPVAKLVREMLSFSVFTPYYSEIVLYSMSELLKKNEDGISILFYLQKIYPDEWKNFLARIGRDEDALDSELFDNPSDILELRFWASYRGQTLARTGNGFFLNAAYRGFHFNAGVYGGVSVFALDFGIEKAFGEYGGSIVFISLAVKDGSKASRQDKPSSWVSERVSYVDIVKNLEGGVGRRDDNGSEGRSRNGIRESLAPQNKFKKTLKIHLDPNGRRRVEWVLERRVQQPRSPLRLALSKGPPEIHKSQQQPKKRVNWALHDTTRKNGTKRANESRVEELGQVKAQSSLKKVVNGSDGGRNEAIRPLALTWVAKGVDKVKKGTEVMGSVLGPVSGEGSEYNSSTHASSKGKEVIQEVDLGPSCSGTKGEMTSHSFFDAEALSSDTSDTETVDDDSLISHFENEEGLLIEQLEREFMEEQKQTK